VRRVGPGLHPRDLRPRLSGGGPGARGLRGRRLRPGGLAALGGIGLWKRVTPAYWDRLGIRDWITLYVSRSEDFSPPGTYGYIYLDADHSFEGVTRDFERTWPWLQEGGMMAFHDIAVEREDYPCGAFGVRRFWQERIVPAFEHLSFDFSAGLGIVKKPKAD